MAIFEYGGGESGIGDYLKFGQKSGRNYSRDKLDHRLVLFGDLDNVEAVINTMDRAEGVERYKHITASFKEDYVSPDVIDAYTKESRDLFLHAYRPDELSVYAEAHIPKVKTYVDASGAEVERKPHIHMVIPTVNLLTGERANPFELMTAKYGGEYSTAEMLDAIQERLNDKYGLESPKDNLRIGAGQADRLDREKADRSDFLKRTTSVPQSIMADVLREDVTSMEGLRAIAERYGDVSIGKSHGVPYFKVKQAGDTKSIRLNDRIFTQDFITLRTSEKRALLDRSGELSQYLEPEWRGTDIEKREHQEMLIREWKELRSREIRYLSPGSKFFREHYRHLSREAKIDVLDRLERGEIVRDNEFSVAPTSTKLNRMTAAQTIDSIELGNRIIAGDQDAIEEAMDVLTEHQSSISKAELQDYLLQHTGDPEAYDKALEQMIRSEYLVVVATGEEERYTSRRIYDIEQKLAETVKRLAESDRHCTGVVNSVGVDTNTMNDGQRGAFFALLSDRQLVVVNGAAGTGKSYVLSRMNEAYQQAGYTVHGAILQGKTAEDLERDSGIKSGTLHSFLLKVDDGRIKLNEKTVIVIDEAGMIGSEQMQRVVSLCEKHGSKLRLVGDAKQVQAVSYGNAFTTISDATGVSGLTEIMRQKVDWQQQASMSFSRHEIAEGLRAYQDAGRISFSESQDDAIDALCAKVRADRQGGFNGFSVVIAKTNAERRELNRQIREGLIEDGVIGGEEAEVITKAGKVPLLTGDKVMFTASNPELRVKNGSSGSVCEITDKAIVVNVDGRKVSIEKGSAVELDYGYAVTVNKSQGVTVDRAYVLAHKSMTANDTYVALTRHKHDVELFASYEHYSKLDPKTGDVAVRGYEVMERRAGQSAIKHFAGDKDEIKVDSNVVDRLVREQRMEAVIAKESNTISVKTIKQEMDLDRLITIASNDYGLDPNKYEIIDGNKIKAGSRELDAVQFMTDELHLDYKTEAMPKLRETYRQQLKNAYIERKPKPTESERREFAGWMKARDEEYKEKLRAVGNAARREKSQANDDLDRISEITDRVARDKLVLKAEYQKPNRELFDQFRDERRDAMERQSVKPAQEPLKRVEQGQSKATVEKTAEKSDKRADAIVAPALMQDEERKRRQKER